MNFLPTVYSPAHRELPFQGGPYVAHKKTCKQLGYFRKEGTGRCASPLKVVDTVPRQTEYLTGGRRHNYSGQ